MIWVWDQAAGITAGRR